MSNQERRDERIPIRTIQHGSALYGTRTPSSDIDTKGIVLPSADDILLRGVLDRSDRTTTKVLPDTTNSSSDVDNATSSLAKYLEHLVAGDPSAVDILFAPSWADLHVPHPIWDTIYRNRARLLSQDMLPRMLSYCRKRIGRYGMVGSAYRSKKVFLDFLESQDWSVRDQTVKLRAVLRAATNTSMLHEDPGIRVYTDLSPGENRVEYRVEVAGKTYLGTDFISEVLTSAQLRVRNHGHPVAAPVPGRDLIEWKILAHAVRTAQQAVELLTHHEVTFPRKNALDLVDIRLGARQYEDIAELLVSTVSEAEGLLRKSDLPAVPDQEWINDLLRYAHRFALEEYLRG